MNKTVGSLTLAALLVLGGPFAPNAAATLAPPQADTYIVAEKNQSTRNFGATDNLLINPTSSTLVRFDLSTLPDGTASGDIEKATILLWVNKVTTAGSISVVPVTSPWTELNVTYNTRPGIVGAIATVPITAATLNQFVVIDVTNQVKSWMTTPGSNYGLELVAVGATAIQFDAKENVVQPMLDIALSNDDPAGVAATIAVGTVTTGAPGSAAKVTNGGTASAAVFNFTIPQGATGSQGAQGLKGDTGAAGTAGTNGAPGAAATISVGTITTGAPGSSAQVANAGTTSAAVLNFTIPRGATGDAGAQGPTGGSGTGGLRVIAGNGTVVGTIVGTEWPRGTGLPVVAANIGGTRMGLVIARSDAQSIDSYFLDVLSSTASDGLLYAQPGCQGTAYIQTNPGNLGPMVGVSERAATTLSGPAGYFDHLAVAASSARSTLPMRSRSSTTTADPRYCIADFGTYSVVPLGAIYDIAEMFPLPLTIQQ